MSFAFRLRADVPRHRPLTMPENQELPFSLMIDGIPECQLIVRKTSEPQSSSRCFHLIIHGRGFASEEEARSAGAAAKLAIRIAGVVAGLPLDIGPDRASSFMAPHIKEKMEQEFGVRLCSDVHGLDVYEDDMTVKVFSGSANLVAGVPLRVLYLLLNKPFTPELDWMKNSHLQ